MEKKESQPLGTPQRIPNVSKSRCQIGLEEEKTLNHKLENLITISQRYFKFKKKNISKWQVSMDIPDIFGIK